jgi:YD repeat-containing protein
MNHQTQYTYDERDNLVFVTSEPGLNISYTYDTAGNLLSVTRVSQKPGVKGETRAAIPDTAQPAPRFCTGCGAALVPGKSFCVSCGKKL